VKLLDLSAWHRVPGVDGVAVKHEQRFSVISRLCFDFREEKKSKGRERQQRGEKGKAARVSRGISIWLGEGIKR
jgi:hypothetical protein